MEKETEKRKQNRAAGILMPIFSLPGAYGIGSLGKEAFRFVDFLHESGQTYWQVLPIGPTGYGDSPYQSFSTFAGNPYFIDLETLIDEGLLTKEECAAVDFGSDAGRVHYEKLYYGRFPLLRKAWERFQRWLGGTGGEAHADGQETPPSGSGRCGSGEANADGRKNRTSAEAATRTKSMKAQTAWADAYPAFLQHSAHWLPAYAQFMAARSGYPEDFYRFPQFMFEQQWKRLKAYANERGIALIGDIPIYVSGDSVDFAEHPELFQLDAEGHPRQIAGCPPDSFSATGQLWGNPIYDWDYHRKTGYAWWIARMRRCFELFDVVRVDHFRGFDEYYAIPAGAKDATSGHWEKGPGIALFDALKAALGEKKIIAEDLGYVTDSVRKLVEDSGFPGMKLLEFGFDSRESGDYRPCTWPEHAVCYTGTHDNQTLSAWMKEISPVDQDFAIRYYMAWKEGRGTEAEVRPRSEAEVARSQAQIEAFLASDYTEALIEMTLSAKPGTAILPLQDYLELGAEARINTPSTLGQNWTFRFKENDFSMETAEKIRRLTEESQRIRREA